MKYLDIAVSSVKQATAYRVEFFSRMGGALLNLVIMWFVWTSVFSASGSESIGGFTLTAMMTYLVVSTMIRPLLGSTMDSSIEDDVKSGRIGTVLIKPVSYPLYKMFMGLSSPIVSLGLNMVPIFAISIFFLGIALPVDAISFSVSVALGFLVSYLITFLVGMWSFWSEGSIWGIRLSKDIISDIMSGSIIPLSLFPASIVNIAQLLPFQTIFNIPISIYLGRISGIGIIYSFMQQAAWIVILSMISYLVWKRAEKKIVDHGG
jgi:ABC-2 type transport system permease protein